MFKRSKEGITAMLCGNVIDPYTLRLQVIGKAKKPSCFKRSVILPVNYKIKKHS